MNSSLKTPEKQFVLILLITFAMFCQTSAFAWDNIVTHPGLTNRAVDLLTTTHPSYMYLQDYAHFDLATDSESQLTFLDEGSVKEDFGSSGASDNWDASVWGSEEDPNVAGNSYLNHGNHPVSEISWDMPVMSGTASKFYEPEIWAIIVDPGTTNPFFHVGRICHLLEDNTSIAHANADQHMDCDDMEEYAKNNYETTAYTAEVVRNPSVDGLTAEAGLPHPDMTEDTHENYMLNSVWRAYYMSTFYGGDLDGTPNVLLDANYDSELFRMFPDLNWVDGWFTDYYNIDAVGDSGDEWWAESSGEDLGYYYIENIDGSDQCSSTGLVPPVFKKDKFRRVLPTDDLDVVLESNTKNLKELFAENMFTLATEWVAGFIKYSADTIQPPVVKIPGDINGDGNVDLMDIITGLKAMAGYSGISVNLDSDVNSDGKVGMPEVLFGIKTISGN